MLENNNTVSEIRSQWSSSLWSSINQRTEGQKAIYKRTLEGKKVHDLQRVCTRLFEAKLLAVRRVTQDNKGKKTAGVDGIKLLPPHKRWELARTIEIDEKADMIKRVWIPLPNSQEKRPLGIPPPKGGPPALCAIEQSKRQRCWHLNQNGRHSSKRTATAFAQEEAPMTQ